MKALKKSSRGVEIIGDCEILLPVELCKIATWREILDTNPSQLFHMQRIAQPGEVSSISAVYSHIEFRSGDCIIEIKPETWSLISRACVEVANGTNDATLDLTKRCGSCE